MQDRLSRILTTWPFLASLLALLANDGWLKEAWPGFVSGKLSDVSGIAVVTLLAVGLAPRRAAASCGALALFFFWWKSPASQAFIELVNLLGWLPIGRVVDYGDLAALAVMPACARVASDPGRFALCAHATRRILIGPLAGLTLFAVVGTSRLPARQAYVVRASRSEGDVERELFAAAIREVAARFDMTCSPGWCEAPRASFSGGGVWLNYTFTEANVVTFHVEAYPDGFIFGKTDWEKADALSASVKQVLAERFQGLEYVEQLTPRR